MNTEIWKAVKGYEGIYEVSNTGFLKSIKFKKPYIYKLNASNGEYLTCTLRKDGIRKSFRIHQIVANAFILQDYMTKGYVVNHIDSNKQNNNVNNLEVITQRMNCIHGRVKKSHSSKYTGVSFYKRDNCWISYIRIGKKNVYLGKYESEIDAANAYNNKLKEIHF